ncbi:hypothetical protein GGF31_003695 [Allomyces arbusculus]|nr:hypothetical protein GGF31_003695 [Allomyces arbusculus]
MLAHNFAALFVAALFAIGTFANPLPAASAGANPVPIALASTDFKSLPFEDVKSAIPLYANNGQLLATAKETVDGFMAVVDASTGTVPASSPFGRAEWVARVPDPEKQANVVLSWSSVWAQLTAFIVEGNGSKITPVARIDETEEDIGGLCAGMNSEGERAAVLVTKGGWVKYYLLDIDHEDNGKVEFEMQRVQTKFLPLKPAEIPSACTIHGVAPHHALIATEAGNVYEVDFSSPNGPSPKPIYNVDAEIPALATFYVEGDKDTAYAVVAEEDATLTVLSRPRVGDWRKVQSLSVKPTVAIEDVSGVSVASAGHGFANGVLTVTSKESGFHFFALDRVLAAAGIVKPGARILGDLPEAMETKAACDADKCHDNGFCVLNGNEKQCVCYEGFTGKKCDERVSCPCPSDRGTCPDKKQPAVCQCKPGFTGPTCSVAAVTPALTLRASDRFENKGSAEDNDDPEVYVHPTNPDDSVIIGTTKSKSDGGLHVWAMDGTELAFAAVPKKSGLNSVDILMNVPVLDAAGKATGEKVDLALAGVRGKINGIGIWRIDPAAISANRKTLATKPGATQAELVPVLIPLTNHIREFNKDTELEVYGSCAFTYTPKSTTAEANTLIITTKKAVAYQYTVSVTRSADGKTEPKATLTLARQWTVGLGSQLENCVGDAETGALYVGEESIGVWRYDLAQFAITDAIPAVPKPAIDQATGRFTIPIGKRTSSDLRQPVLVDSTQLANPNGKLHRDVEGLALYADPAKRGQRTLVVSSQGANEYNLYDVSSPTNFAFRGKFAIRAGPKGDAVTKTDSLAVSSAKMGGFARGVLVVHDDATTAGADLTQVQKQATFKVVDWADVEKLVV